MCGIVGYTGKRVAAPLLIEGLARLEYRGYDSAGVAIVGKTKTAVHKVTGRVADLEAALPKRIAGATGIAHTRWATHGPVTAANAHPHTSAAGRINLVHNGIFDDAATVREDLQSAGVEFSSDTDSEVLAHMISRALDAEPNRPLAEAVIDALGRLSGTYAIAVTDQQQPNQIVVARNGSPLAIGVGDGEMFVASDEAAFVAHTSSVIHLEDGELATVSPGSFTTFTHDLADTGRVPTTSAVTVEEFEKTGFEHYMRKELAEQPDTWQRLVHGRMDTTFATARLDGLNLDPRSLRGFHRVKILGAGAALFAGRYGAGLIESLARLPADAESASAFRYRNPIVDPKTLYVAVSQSGETADLLFAVNEIKRKGATVVGLINVVGSTIARQCDGGVYLHAGPEVSVASTKALTHMCGGFALLALLLGRVRDLSHTEGGRLLTALAEMPSLVEQVLATEPTLIELAAGLADHQSMFVVGRGLSYPAAQEGALKFKEIAYLHAEAYDGGELKHGPLALIEESRPSIALIPADHLVARNLATAQQISSRGGPLITIAQAGVDVSELPGTPVILPASEPELAPILMMIAQQLLAYHTAKVLGHDIDKPRNLAKAVTVE